MKDQDRTARVPPLAVATAIGIAAIFVCNGAALAQQTTQPVQSTQPTKPRAQAAQAARPAAPSGVTQTAAPPSAGVQPQLLGQYGDRGAYMATPGGKKVCFALAKPAVDADRRPFRFFQVHARGIDEP